MAHMGMLKLHRIHTSGSEDVLLEKWRIVPPCFLVDVQAAALSASQASPASSASSGESGASSGPNLWKRVAFHLPLEFSPLRKYVATTPFFVFLVFDSS
mmetsp:Transcript_84480/g.161500  ORF Transcript_84480/g.161500 Transcript_84480/m.161500 type:complete len:99 (-) Transcript_84480:772-1068(-)